MLHTGDMPVNTNGTGNVMKHIATLTVSTAALLAVGACDSGVIKADETAATQETGDVTLADVRASVEAEPDTSVPSIDPASANIDPFSGVYPSEERDAYKTAATSASMNVDDAISQTEDMLATKAVSIDANEYRDGLNCAARFDLASKKGALPAHQAQTFGQEALSATAIGYEQFISPNASEDEREQLVADYREQTYRNYLLVRDELTSEASGDALLAEAESCYAALGLQPEEPVSETEEETEMPAES